MKKMFYLGLALLFLVVISTKSFAVKFIEGLEDVPVMEGLVQTTSDNVAFGNEESRFVEVFLDGSNTNFAKVEKFYKETLPQMGWVFQGKRKSVLTFYRDAESLEIVREKKDPLTIRITVKSRS